MRKKRVETIEKTSNPPKDKVILNNKQIADVLYGKKIKLRCKNQKQKEFIKSIDENQISICIGPAGVGKSYLSIIKALKMLANPDNNFQNIYIITPAVEAEEKLGFLPGNMEEKLEPYLYSTYKLIDKIIGSDNRKKLVDAEIIKPVALAYLRGWNIDNSILIFEEAQNATRKQMKTVLTRIGFNSKFIISGDLEQSDRFNEKEKCGLYEAFSLMKGERDIGTFEFVVENDEEIIRNPLIARILNRYDLKE